MRDPDPELVARRVRAARSYAKLSRKRLAAAINVSPSTLDLIEGKRSVQRGASWTELANIAAACGLPADFFTADFERLDRIPQQGVPRLPTPREAGSTPAPPGELGHRARDPAPMPQDRARRATRKAEDSQRGSGG